MIQLQLVVNGKEFSSLNDVPDGMRRLVAQQLAGLQLSAEQLRGQRRIVINIPKRLLREQEEERQTGQSHSISAIPEESDAWPRAPEPLSGNDRYDDRPSYSAPARQPYSPPARPDSQGPLLGSGDPSPLSKHLLALIAASFAAWAFYNAFAR